MREDKKYLVQEVVQHLSKSDYLYLTDFQRITVSDVAQLRKDLSAQSAEFHVVKNTILNVALKSLGVADLSMHLQGQTAIVIGGENPSEVAKVLVNFNKTKDSKGAIKVGLVAGQPMSCADVIELSKLPGKDALRAQLLSLFNTPATQMARVLDAYVQSQEGQAA